MAVLIQFTTVLIRIDRLEAASPGGIAALQARWSPSWRDDHLLAVAFMDDGARDLGAELERMGLILRDTSSGKRVWRDICVIDYYEGPTNPCPWLGYDPAGHVAWLEGTIPGAVVGPPHRHEEAPLRASPQKFQQLVQEQHVRKEPVPKQPAAPASSHEDTLLPLSQRIAAALLHLIPRSAKLEALIFAAHFPQPGQVVTAGLILHDLQGERRAIRFTQAGEEANRLLTTCSRYPSGQRLTSIEIKIAADGQTTTSFGAAPPRGAEALQAYMHSLYGSIPDAPAPTRRGQGGFFGWLRALFAPRPRHYFLPTLQHRPQSEPLSMLLDLLDGIHEDWDNELPAPATSSSSAPAPRPPGPAFDLGELHRLEADRAAPALRPLPSNTAESLVGKHLVIPAEEGVLLGEARDFRRVALVELHRLRPTLRFDPIKERLSRDLGPGLGELSFAVWNGNISRLNLVGQDVPTFEALLASLQPVLVALGGMGPIVSALGASGGPAQVRDVKPIPLDELRAYLARGSAHGSLVYPCWLLGGPPHTKVGLDLSVGLVDGHPSFGYYVSVSLR